MAATTPPKRVWIVGAGFSRPLGGPLLADLLSESARHQIELRYKDGGIELTQAPASRIVYWLYNLGKTTNGFDLEDWVQSDYPPKINIHRKWDNAEDFLAWLDDAANSEGGYPADEYQWILQSYRAIQRQARPGTPLQSLPAERTAVQASPFQAIRLSAFLLWAFSLAPAGFLAFART